MVYEREQLTAQWKDFHLDLTKCMGIYDIPIGYLDIWKSHLRIGFTGSWR